MKPLYQPLSATILRTPLLPIERYFELADPARLLTLLSDLRVERAVWVGSPSLAAAIERFKSSELSARDADRMRAKLLRYLIRMCTRPTPYGLFAGVAVVPFGNETNAQMISASARGRTRPDMGWLLKFVAAAEAEPVIRRQLNFIADPLVDFEAGRATVPGNARSIRATGVVRRALSLARHPIAYSQLASDLGGPPDKIEKLLDQLWEYRFLRTDLRPPLTGADPAAYVAARLEQIPEAASRLEKLNSLRHAARDWDSGRTTFPALLAAAEAPLDGSGPTPVQQDLATDINGSIDIRIGEEAARAAELLLRLSPFPRGSGSLAAYRQQFVNKYGLNREIPLLDLLHPSRGLGPPSGYSYALVAPDPEKSARRSRLLMQLACVALRDRQRIIDLDEALIAQLESWRPEPQTAPLSLDLNILVAASSTEAIDRGEFSLVIGPNLGGMAAGRNLGRFADVIGPAAAHALEETARAEQAHAAEEVCAEIVYLPSNHRLANVVIRPAIRAYELVLDTTPWAPVISPDDLLVGVDCGRFYIRSESHNKRVRFTSGHMLNYHSGPPLVRFLLDAANDAKASFSSFDWGQMENFEYLPRLQAGRIVLRPAQWRITKERFSLDHWRRAWQVPRYISLSSGDNRLLLDLDQDSHTAELKAEVQKLADGQYLVVQEVFPPLEELWLSGPEGRYYSELVVSVVLCPEKKEARPVTPTLPFSWTIPRTHPPGGEWLFAKLYCPGNLENGLISGSLSAFAENCVAAGWTDSWFFIRYADPESHLRLRFHGVPELLTSRVFPQICNWAKELLDEGICRKLMFDTYEQEIERFGGPAGMAAAETLFWADSRAAAKLIDLFQPHDSMPLLALSVDDLLASLGLDERTRLSWYRRQGDARSAEIGADYRERKRALRSAIGDPRQYLSGLEAGAEIAATLDTRHEQIAPVGEHLRALAEQKSLSQSIDELCASFVHLHLNRLGATTERRLLSLLVRTREGLAQSGQLTFSSSA
ncbi:MAG TPA: lantibiotic dehydratase [Bryobacteraceae bacterium]